MLKNIMACFPARRAGRRVGGLKKSQRIFPGNSPGGLGDVKAPDPLISKVPTTTAEPELESTVQTHLMCIMHPAPRYVQLSPRRHPKHIPVDVGWLETGEKE